jgi:hypothetical protein
MKKKYIKPTMRVDEFEEQFQLLIGSIPDWDRPVGYSSDTDQDNGLNHHA